MNSFGLAMKGSLIVEKVPTIPIWSVNDIGRVIYCEDTTAYFLGAHSSQYGENGWIILGLSKHTIKNYHIDWDTELSGAFGKVSAVDVPGKFGNITGSIQDIFDYISKQFLDLQNGTLLAEHCIRDYHIKWEGSGAVTSSDIIIDNLENHFTGDPVNLEDALSSLANKDASVIPLESSGSFGTKLGFTTTSVQTGLESIEDWLSGMTASIIPCTYKGMDDCKSTVQKTLDYLFDYYHKIKFTDLVDVPNYNKDKRFLKSNGENCLDWVELYGGDIKCFFPGNAKSNVQVALNTICSELGELCTLFNHTHMAYEIGYQNPITESDHVEGSLNWLTNHCWTDIKCQPANVTPCALVGNHQNVNDALLFLYQEVLELQSLIPCAHLPITSNPLSTSDKQLKENIEPLDNCLDIINSLQGVSFKWIDNRNDCTIGLIAQDVEKILPSAVGSITENNIEYKGIYYDRIIPVVIEAIKEHNKLISDLLCQLKELKNK